jgi:2',3'-cyclic-nucleotide 2'-phosphodiesterase (5'-nucleotidase family)
VHLRILSTNDMHGTLSGAVFDELLLLRKHADLYFDCGDCIKTGNLGVPLKQEPVWSRLSQLECTASVLGNRETHLLESAFRKKLQGAAHPVLCGNLRSKNGSYPLPRTLETEVRGVRVGVVAVMVPMVTERMKTQAASAYLWDPPIATAKLLAPELRPRVDILIALTHIGHKQDLKLAEECPLFDIVLGGHSHTVLSEPVRIGSTYICQAGSHNRFAGMYEWAGGEGLSGGLRNLGR